MRRITFFFLVLFCVAVMAGEVSAGTTVNTWQNPSLKIDKLNKILVLPVRYDLRTGLSLQPQNELQSNLEKWAVEGVKSALNNPKKKKRVTVKTLSEFCNEMTLKYGDVPESLDVFVQRGREMGYQAFTIIDVMQDTYTEKMPDWVIPYTSYNTGYVYNNKGWVAGSVSIPQNNAITIPGQNVTYLYTGCQPKLFLAEDYMGDYRAVAKYEINRQYRGGDVIKVIEIAIKDSIKSMLTGKK